MKSDVFIYALVDPRDNRIRYIGKSVNVIKRYKQHLRSEYKDGSPKKTKWIKELLAQGLSPCLGSIEKTDLDNWQDAERSWICRLRPQLTNGTDGGGGNPQHPTSKYFPHLRDKIISDSRAERICRAVVSVLHSSLTENRIERHVSACAWIIYQKKNPLSPLEDKEKWEKLKSYMHDAMLQVLRGHADNILDTLMRCVTSFNKRRNAA